MFMPNWKSRYLPRSWAVIREEKKATHRTDAGNTRELIMGFSLETWKGLLVPAICDAAVLRVI
jgi:hypothetical protein